MSGTLAGMLQATPGAQREVSQDPVRAGRAVHDGGARLLRGRAPQRESATSARCLLASQGEPDSHLEGRAGAEGCQRGRAAGQQATVDADAKAGQDDSPPPKRARATYSGQLMAIAQRERGEACNRDARAARFGPCPKFGTDQTLTRNFSSLPTGLNGYRRASFSGFATGLAQTTNPPRF